MSFADNNPSSPVYDGLSDPFHYKHLQPLSYSAASQCHAASHQQHTNIDTLLPTLPQLSPLPDQMSSRCDGSGGDHIIDRHVLHRHGQSRPPHDLYPAPPHLDPLELFPPSITEQQQHPQVKGWPAFDHGVTLGYPPNHASYPTASPFPPPRLTPPPTQHFDGGNQINGGPRLTLAGSLDPSTGIFYRTPEHPRLRTAQACEKCRTRKAKCSGEHPSCNRCLTRGLVCEYAKEGRVRGPNKPKSITGNESRSASSSRPSSVHGSFSSEAPEAPSSSAAPPNSNQNTPDNHMPVVHLSYTPRGSSNPGPLSLGEHRSTRPRPPDLRLESASNHYRLDGPRSSTLPDGDERLSHQPFKFTPHARYPSPNNNARFAYGSHAHSHSLDSHVREQNAIFQQQQQQQQAQGPQLPLPLPPLQTAISMDDMRHFAAEENYGCPSSDRSGQGQVPHMSGAMFSLTRSTYLHERQHSNSNSNNSDGGSLSNPHSAASLTFNSSPTSAMGSPITPASSTMTTHFSREGDILHSNFDPPQHQQQQQQNPRASLQIDPIWADVHSNPDFGGQFRRLEKNRWENSPAEAAGNEAYHRETEQASLSPYPMDIQMC